MSWIGMPGAMAIGNKSIEEVIERISTERGVDKRDVLIGTREEPPDVAWCVVYAVCTHGGAIVWMRKGRRPDGEWFNWSYTDQDDRRFFG